MPTYEYKCPNGHDFELVRRMSDPPEAKCPVCGAEAERVISSGAGFLFKGSGFYITDYRSDTYKKAAQSEGGGGGEKKSDTSTPSKSDTSGDSSGSSSKPDSGSKSD